MSRWLVGLILVVIAYTAHLPQAAASTEDCIQCKHVDCLKGLIKQKTAMANGYDALARKWQQSHGNDLTINFNRVDKARRYAAYLDMVARHDAFDVEVNAMAQGVGLPAGCGLDEGLEVSTNTYANCNVDIEQLVDAVKKSPCKQIADLIAAHEGMHRDRCMERKDRNDYWSHSLPASATGAATVVYYPPVMQTPAGKATEEALAYRKEVQELKKLLEPAEKKCEISFNNVSTSCRLPGGIIMGQDISGKVCGNPVSANWTINTVSWVRGPVNGRNVDPPWDSDCVAKGSDEERRRAAIYEAGPAGGWMCVYEPGDAPKIHIRYFRLKQCTPSTELMITVPAQRAECEADPAPEPPLPDPDRPVG